jgi:hypothetical protein
MKKINIVHAIILFLLVVSVVSCKKDDYNAGGTSTQALANEWWVQIDDGHPTDPNFGPGYFNLSTYNTAADDGTQMWFDDMKNSKSFWDIKGKVNINVGAQTFSGTNIANQYYSSKFTITNGKVITNGAHATGSKTVVDSIFLNITFDDDLPGSPVHKISGYARTKFPEDDH